MLKTLLFFSLIIFFTFGSFAQMLYSDYEPNGVKFHSFGHYNGILDSSFANPVKTGINNSNFSAKYIRNDTVHY
ncbi:MAG: hypothetical protein H0X62_10780, partial [Bacteroidetes bacterium]|nr:hypothetical protein [Bacteroidota bacterium]